MPWLPQTSIELERHVDVPVSPVMSHIRLQVPLKPSHLVYWHEVGSDSCNSVPQRFALQWISSCNMTFCLHMYSFLCIRHAGIIQWSILIIYLPTKKATIIAGPKMAWSSAIFLRTDCLLTRGSSLSSMPYQPWLNGPHSTPRRNSRPGWKS